MALVGVAVAVSRVRIIFYRKANLWVWSVGFIYDGFYTTDDFNYVNGQYILKEGVADLGSFINPVHGVDRPSGQNAYPGLPKFRDMDNSGSIDEKDVTIIGDMNPVHTGGFNINTTYKNFDLGLYFNWSYGNDVYNVNKNRFLVRRKRKREYMRINLVL